MSESVTYEFEIGTTQFVLVAGVSTPATNSTGFGVGYAVTSIGGLLGDQLITSEVGTGGSQQFGRVGDQFDNTIFTSNASGATFNGQSGSLDGLDIDGLEFTAGGDTYNLYVSNGVFVLDNLTVFSRTNPVLVGTTVPCFCPGTLILTSRGERPVESLRIDDVVVVASGQHRAVKWIGQRSYAGRFLAANPGVQPVRFQAGSLGNGLPRRDLLVSPDHAMFLDGLLIPARALVNGLSIVREHGLTRVDYCHVELDSHDVLLAEGAPSESFVDDDSRGLFHNAHEFASLYPSAPAPAGFCAPRAEHGPEVEAVRRRLAEGAVQAEAA